MIYKCTCLYADRYLMPQYHPAQITTISSIFILLIWSTALEIGVILDEGNIRISVHQFYNFPLLYIFYYYCL